MPLTRLFLLRHGQVEGHREKRYNGQSDVALTRQGRAQMDLWCDLLTSCGPQAVYASDLARCRYGAERLADRLGLQAHCAPVLRELDCGEWQGRPWTELQAAFPEQWQARFRDIVNYRFPGGESFLDAANRVRPFFQGLLEQHAGARIVLFGHGGINRILLLDALGMPLDKAFRIVQDFGCLNIVDYLEDGSIRVRLLNGSASPTACDEPPA